MNAETTMYKKKDQYFQQIRGISMIAVVLIHCKTAENITGWELGYWVVLRQLINFAVALYVFMAGYFAKKISWDRVKKLIIPYITWSLIYCVINGEIRFKEILKAILNGSASLQLYYMVVLIELTLIAPFLCKILNKSDWYGRFILFITPIYLFIVSIIQYSGNVNILWKGKNALAWISFYFFGMLVKNGQVKLKIKLLYIFLLYLVSFIFCLLEAKWCIKFLSNLSMAVSQVKISSFVSSMIIIVLVLKIYNLNKREITSNFLTRIGDVSYGIYFLHPLVIRGFNKILGRNIKLSLPLYHTVQLTVTLVVCYMIILIIRRIDYQKKVCLFLGF